MAGQRSFQLDETSRRFDATICFLREDAKSKIPQRTNLCFFAAHTQHPIRQPLSSGDQKRSKNALWWLGGGGSPDPLPFPQTPSLLPSHLYHSALYIVPCPPSDFKTSPLCPDHPDRDLPESSLCTHFSHTALYDNECFPCTTTHPTISHLYITIFYHTAPLPPFGATTKPNPRALVSVNFLWGNLRACIVRSPPTRAFPFSSPTDP